jgi:hypothetical protein
MKQKIKDKWIVCKGCNTGYTINFKANEKAKSSICDKCGKHNIYQIIDKKVV